MEITILQQPADHVRLVEKEGEKVWQVNTKEYGWERVKKFQAIMALHNCTKVHNWKDLGDPCSLCGSDNCAICLGCGINTHD